jgi:hypothetical protein
MPTHVIQTVADLVAVLLQLPQDARVIMSDTHEFESIVAAAQVDEGDVVIYGGIPRGSMRTMERVSDDRRRDLEGGPRAGCEGSVSFEDGRHGYLRSTRRGCPFHPLGVAS